MISTLTTQISVGINWNAQFNLVGTDYQPLTNVGQINKTMSNGTAIANAAAGGANQFISFIQTISASSSATLDLTSITNILQQTGVSLARLKGVIVRLLSPTDDAVNGTACASITVGNAASNQCPLEMTSGTMTFNVKNGGAHAHFDTSAAGMCTVGSGAKNIKILNNDTISAAVQVTFVGGDT